MNKRELEAADEIERLRAELESVGRLRPERNEMDITRRLRAHALPVTRQPKLLDLMREAIRVRHYALTTESAATTVQ